jgi:hypothetical protein
LYFNFYSGSSSSSSSSSYYYYYISTSDKILSTEHRNFHFANKNIKTPFSCSMTPRHCAMFSRRCQTNYLSRYFGNRVSSDVASYPEGKETSHTVARTYKLQITRRFYMSKLSLRFKR